MAIAFSVGIGCQHEIDHAAESDRNVPHTAVTTRNARSVALEGRGLTLDVNRDTIRHESTGLIFHRIEVRPAAIMLAERYWPTDLGAFPKQQCPEQFYISQTEITTRQYELIGGRREARLRSVFGWDATDGDLPLVDVPPIEMESALVGVGWALPTCLEWCLAQFSVCKDDAEYAEDIANANWLGSEFFDHSRSGAFVVGLPSRRDAFPIMVSPSALVSRSQLLIGMLGNVSEVCMRTADDSRRFPALGGSWGTQISERSRSVPCLMTDASYGASTVGCRPVIRVSKQK